MEPATSQRSPSRPIGPVVRVLVVQTAGIGDALLTTPAIRALAERFPGAVIDTLSKPAAREVFQCNPHVRRALTLDRGPRSVLRAVLDARRARYDLLVDYHCKVRTAWLALLGGARNRLGYDRRRIGWRAGLYDLHGSEEGTTYSAAGRIALLKPLGVLATDPTPEFVPEETERARAEDFLLRSGAAAAGRRIALSPATRFPSKTWPREHWIALTRAFAARGYAVFAVASPQDDQRVVAMGREADGALVVAPSGSLSFLAALFARMDLVVSDCSGPRHLAVSQGTPTLTLHGGNLVAPWTHPAPIHRAVRLGLDCQPCQRERCPLGTTECLRDLPPERVLAEAQDLLERAVARV